MAFIGSPSNASSAAWVWRSPRGCTRFSIPARRASRGMSPRTYALATGCPPERAEQGSAPVDAQRGPLIQAPLDHGDHRTGAPVPGKFEFFFRDSTHRQRWQTAKGDTLADAKAERAEVVARLHRGERVERTKRTVSEAAQAWLERGRGQRGPWDPVTRERYERIVRRHVLGSADPQRRPLGEMKLRDLTPDHVAEWSQRNEQTLARDTAQLPLIALNQNLPLRRAARLDGRQPRRVPGAGREAAGQGGRGPHPRRARPRTPRRPRRPVPRPLAFLPYCGLRIGEALGLRWCDVNLDAGLLHVRQQLSRRRTPKQLKTPAAQREVVLAPALVTLLREHWLASAHKAPGDLVFCTALGRGLNYREVGEGFRAAVKAAGLTGPGRLTLHSLRHTFTSLLIAKGLDVVFVSRQLGHASPTTTLGVYAHLFGQAEHAAAAARAVLEASYQTMTGMPPREPTDAGSRSVVALLVAGEIGARRALKNKGEAPCRTSPSGS